MTLWPSCLERAERLVAELPAIARCADHGDGLHVPIIAPALRRCPGRAEPYWATSSGVGAPARSSRSCFSSGLTFLPRPRPPGRSRIPTRPSTRKPRARWSKASDWLTPHFNYEERWQKPILYYWVHRRSIRRNRYDRVHGALRVGALRPRARAADVGRGPPAHRERRTAPGSRARSRRPVSATSLMARFGAA